MGWFCLLPDELKINWKKESLPSNKEDLAGMYTAKYFHRQIMQLNSASQYGA